MNTEAFSSVARESVNRLSSRLADEKRHLVLFLIELADFDRKKHGIELGYPSTLGCLMGELEMDESSACRRIAAARLLARFPAVAPYLLASRLTMTTLVALKEVLDESNVDDVLARAAGLSAPDVRDLVMRMRMAAQRPPASTETSAPSQVAPEVAVAAKVEDANAGSAAGPGAAPAPPVEELTTVTLRVGREFMETLAAVRDLLSHAVPSGKKEDVLLHALKQVRKLNERRRYGSANRKPTPAKPPSTTGDRVVAADKREVHDRDGGTCAYVSSEGKRCNATWQLEYQHIDPRARRGPSTPTNLTLFCRPHNLLQAEKDFGPEYIAARIEERRNKPAPPAPTPPAPHPATADVISALKNMGFKAKEAEQAVALAAPHLPPDSDLMQLLRESLRVTAPAFMRPR